VLKDKEETWLTVLPELERREGEAGGMTHVVECLPSKSKALSSNHSTVGGKVAVPKENSNSGEKGTDTSKQTTGMSHTQSVLLHICKIIFYPWHFQFPSVFNAKYYFSDYWPKGLGIEAYDCIPCYTGGVKAKSLQDPISTSKSAMVVHTCGPGT
jgi:hypothetical protein